MTIAPTAPRTKWILSPVGDLLLFIGLPLVIVAILQALTLGFTPVEIYALAFGSLSLGHHLPGFLKAYGDREIFARNKVALLLAPPLTFAVSLTLFQAHFTSGVTLMMVWALWHGFMQNFGILRAYDARAQAYSAVTARMDRAFCVLLCAACYFFWRQDSTYGIMTGLYSSGLPLVSKATFALAEQLIVPAFCGFVVIYLGYHAWLWRTGRAFNPLKLLFAVFIAGFYFVMSSAHALGAMFAVLSAEMFHDISYFAIAYGAGRQTVKAGHGRGPLMRALFGGGAVRCAAYVLVIGLYGALDHLRGVLTPAAAPVLANIFAAFVMTSGFLHYYTDSFIWRNPRAARPAPGLWRGGAKVWQPVVAVALLAVFTLGQRQKSPGEDLRVASHLVDVLPESKSARLELADGLREQGVLGAAGAVYQSALALDADSVPAHIGLGKILTTATDPQLRAEGEMHFQRAVVLNPALKDQIARLRLKADARSRTLSGND